MIEEKEYSKNRTATISARVNSKTPQTVLTLEVVTPSVQQVEDRLAKTMKRDLDAPALRENWPYDFGKVFTEIRHVPATERYRVIKSLQRPSETSLFPAQVATKTLVARLQPLTR